MHIGNNELRADGHAAAGGSRGDYHCHFMILPVYAERAVNRSLRQIDLHALRRENYFGIAVALQDVLVHALVPRFVSGGAALGVDNDLPGGFARGEIMMHRSPLQFESALDGVENVT
jgi:hypothetical protein